MVLQATIFSAKSNLIDAITLKKQVFTNKKT